MPLATEAHKSEALLPAHQKSGLEDFTLTLLVKLQEAPALLALPAQAGSRRSCFVLGILELLSITGWG